MRNVLREWLALVGLLFLLCENSVAAERSEEVVYIQWDSMYVVIVKGELIESAGTKGSSASIFLDSAPGSFHINEQTKNNGAVLTPGVPFEFKYQFFWGGMSVAGEEREEPELKFRLRIQGETGKCFISDSAPTEENEQGGVMTLDIGQFVLETPCNG